MCGDAPKLCDQYCIVQVKTTGLLRGVIVYRTVGSVSGRGRQGLARQGVPAMCPIGGATADSHGLSRLARQETRRSANPQVAALQRHRLPKLIVRVRFPLPAPRCIHMHRRNACHTGSRRDQPSTRSPGITTHGQGLRCLQEIPTDPEGKRRVGMNG
jgi:hypothetical protein